jgi:hypothetical protein
MRRSNFFPPTRYGLSTYLHQPVIRSSRYILRVKPDSLILAKDSWATC